MLRIMIAALLVCFIAGCSREAPPADVDKAGALFFERLKGADYEAIYADASSQFKEAKSKGEILDNLQQITAIGRIQSYSRLSMFFEGDKSRIASPVYSVLFDQAAAEITLNFKDDGGEWKLVGFSLKRRGPPS
ncbi:MAG: hypothetical protein AB1631_11440 [Acidobacteriota bacterium]